MTVLMATACARAQELREQCYGDDPERRVAPCTALIEAPDTPSAVRANAYFQRGLSHSQRGQYERAIPDYDAAIRINPRFGSALNNRANARLKLGRPSEGVEDIELAVKIQPRHPVFNATRGEIGQALGDSEAAMRDHKAAMAFGGREWVKIYQCSLRLARLYHGPLDGNATPELYTALRLCVDQGSRCASVPPWPVSECPEPVS
jgi:tetratricopeptide (TPR) repeat protein